ncbi:MAG: hypothetical protein OXG39_10870 [Chloroflexi bacterium]|nr:hypothetical protein [Chloroflexota bacterium]
MKKGSAGTRSSLSNAGVLVMLFLGFRLLMFLAYQPVLTEHGEAGIGAGGDRLFHFRLAALADEGKFPFRDWWSEFPPIWPAISTGVFLLLGEGVNYSNWSLVLGMLMLAFETGNLLLVRGIGCLLYGNSTGGNLAWVYALSIAPAIFMWWNFDSMMNFFFLMGIYYLIKGRDSQAALAIALGILVKFVPALVCGAIIRYRRPMPIIRFATLGAIVVVLAYLPLFAINYELASVSLRAQAEKPSSQTIWALLDGNYATGNFGPVEDRLKEPGEVDNGDRNGARIPNWLRLAVAAGLGLLVFLTTRRDDDRALIAFVGVTILIFYLQAQAWSPQWVSLIIPLTLLAFPSARGVLATIVLSLLAFAEYPVLWSRTADLDPPGEMGGEWFLPWALIVLLRTGLLAGLAAAFYKVLREHVAAPETTGQERQ